MTHPSLDAWPPTDRSFRRSEITASLGSGQGVWERVSRDVLRWKVKTASGFRVEGSEAVTAGQFVTITARVLGMRIVEPVEVVSVVESDDRVGFSYRTLPGHPVRGEEAFIVHRADDGIRLTIRSLTRPAPQQPWRALWPVLLLAQRVARRRYRRALR
jgi:uncharacterized protein (UPF0548 family)